MAIGFDSTFTKVLSSRKVCVINLHEEPYVEEFKGEKIVIPPMGKREVFMPQWKARKFLASCDAPPIMDYTGQLIKGGKVKMLRLVELTSDEEKKLGEVSIDEAYKKQSEADDQASLSCGYCGFEGKNNQSLKMHMRKSHPESLSE